MTFSLPRAVGLVAAALTVAAVRPLSAQQPPPTPPAGKPAAPNATVPPVAAAPKPKPPVKLPSNVVARVDGQDITRDHVLAMFDMVGGRPIVDQMVQSVILEQEAKRLGVTVSQAEINQGVKDAKQRIVSQAMMQGMPKTFEQIAAEEGFTNDLIRWSVRLDLLRRKAFAKSVESQVPSRDKQVKMAHILAATIPLPKSPNEEVKPLTPEQQKEKEAAAKTKIDGILADLKAGKTTWDDAAKLSDDQSNNTKGGELDYYGPGMLDPEFEKAGFGIKKEGEIVGPVKSNFGWHLIKLVKRGKDLPKAEKDAYRKQQLDQITMNPQLLQNWMNSLREKRNVVINRQARIVPGAVSPVRGFAAPAAPGRKPAAPVKRSSRN